MFDYLVKTPSDINEHMETLRDLSKECEHIVEMGVRKCVSTWAFIEGMEKGKLIGVDIKSPEDYGVSIIPVENACAEKGIEYHFLKEDSLKVNIPPTDMLFIDTLHTYEQLKKELKRHGKKAKKYIVLHDTTSCPEMWQAVEEFIGEGWQIKDRFINNNGLTILERC